MTKSRVDEPGTSFGTGDAAQASLSPPGCCQGRAEQIDLYFLSGPAVSWPVRGDPMCGRLWRAGWNVCSYVGRSHQCAQWFKLVGEFVLSLVQGYAQVLSTPVEGVRGSSVHRIALAGMTLAMRAARRWARLPSASRR